VRPIREQVVERFRQVVRGGTPDEDLADALYALLRSIDTNVAVDGWSLFRVVRESIHALDAVGLMTLLPSHAVPIDISVLAQGGGFEWAVRIGREDEPWLTLSSDKQWNSVYLYATTETESPPWTWGPLHVGSME
jgi:hypothetical protein